MVRFCLIAVAAALALLASSCVIPALQPFYTAESLAYDPALIGTWSPPEGGESYTFGDDAAGGYSLLVAMSDGTTASFSCHLFTLAGRQFLDMIPDVGDEGVPGYTFWHLAPLHTVYVVEQIRPTLKLETLDPDWLLPYLEEHPEEMARGNIDLPNDNELPVFTGSTAELQTFLIRHINTPGALYGETELEPAPDLLSLPSGIGMGMPQN